MTEKPQLPSDPGQAAQLYAGWLDELLAQAEGPGLARMRQAAQLLLPVCGPWQGTALVQACDGLEASLAEIDLAQLDRAGWLARLLGARRRTGRVLAFRYRTVIERDGAVRERCAEFAALMESRREALRKPLLDLELESRSLGEALARGSEWLEALSAALAHVRAPDVALLRFAASVGPRLKRLHLVGAAAGQVVALCGQSQQASAALLELLGGEWRQSAAAWQSQLRPVVDDLCGGRSPDPVERAARVHKEARRLIHRVRASCTHLKQQEDQLLQGLQALSAE